MFEKGLSCGIVIAVVVVTYFGGLSRSSAEDVSGPLSPEDTIKNLTIPKDLEVTLFASEPMVRNPAVIDIDSKGRVWAAEGLNYRRYRDMVPEGDRIIILEDTDGDGKADSEKTYYQGKDVDNALGLCVIGNKLIVSRSPHVFIFTDEDGDDKPDKKEILFQGLSGEQHDHGVHSFVFGPDGKFYFNSGNEGKQLLDTNGKPVVDMAGNEVNASINPYQQGMIFRCNLDGSEFETLAWNFRNNYEVAVDSFGQLWQSDNDDDGNQGVRINYVLPFGNYGYKGEMDGANWRSERINREEEIPIRHWFQNDPGVVPNLLQTMWGSPTGILIYEGDLLPQRFQNEMIHCDAGPRVVRAYPVEEDGAGYKAEIENLIQGRDTWFRPADVCVAPDGSVLVSDWYDPGVGGHAMGDHDPTSIRGRIYRVAPKGHAWSIPEFDLSSPESCVEALKSPNLARRYLAWTALREMKREAEPALKELWADPNPRFRARALHLLARFKNRGWDYIEEALHDENPDIRIAGLKIAQEEKLDPIPFIKMVLADDSPRVRAEAAILLRGNSSEEASNYWAELAALHNGKDRWYLEALGIGAEGQWDRFFAAWLDRQGKGWDTAAGHDIVWRARGSQASEYMVKILKQRGPSYEDSARYLRALQFQPEKDRNEALVALLEETSENIGESKGWGRIGVDLVTMFQPSPYDREVLKKDLGNWLADAAKGTPQLVRVIEAFGLSERYPMLMEYALETEETSHIGSALTPLAHEANQATLMTALESEDVTQSVQLVERLGHVDHKTVTSLLSSIVTDRDWETPIRGAAVIGLTKSRKGAQEVLDLARSGDLPSEFTNLAAIKLNSVPRNWDDIRDEAPKLLPLPANKEGEAFPPYSELAKMTGDAGHGSEVFKQLCMVCHKVKGEGVEFGPDLSNIGGKLGKDALYENILNPNSAVSFGYEPITVVLGDEEEEYGFLLEDNDSEVVLRVQSGENVRISREDIQEIREEKLSAMPVGLEQGMTTQDLVDLLEYLTTLRG